MRSLRSRLTSINRRAHLAAVAVAALVMLAGSGCATVGAPVLHHQTGETLGQKRFRVFGHYETSRIFAPASTAETLGIEQDNSIFQGSFLGVEVDGGVLPQLDLQLGANFTAGGGGWRLGAKYQILRNGRIAVAAMAGYAATSGSGTYTYLTAATPVEIQQTLSASTIDLSMPVSYRVAGPFIVYGGPQFLRSGVSGSFGSAFVEDSTVDWGLNLGVQVTYGVFMGDLEVAEVLVQDPFTDSHRLIPFVGLSFGMMF